MSIRLFLPYQPFYRLFLVGGLLFVQLLTLGVFQTTHAQNAANFARRTIIVSIDGLRPDVITNLGADQLPAFYRFLNEGATTLNARSDPKFTSTMPNHASMMTARWVNGAGSHGWARNVDSQSGGTIHTENNQYVPSIFDVVHDEGGRTGLYATKEKFELFDRSYNDQNGRQDLTTPDYGKDKIDTFVYLDLSSDLMDRFFQDASTNPYDFSFLHLADPDRQGHATGWDIGITSAYAEAIRDADEQIGRLLSFVESDPSWMGSTNIIITADHGGTGINHNDPSVYEHNRIIFGTWGPGVEAGIDLYTINANTRLDPGTNHIEQAVESERQPIRNGDAPNLALKMMGLPPIPRSTINANRSLLVKTPIIATDSLPSILAFQDGVLPDTSWHGMMDTKIRSDASDIVFGAYTNLEVDAGPDYAALLRWDLSDVPQDVTITRASIRLYITNVSPTTYDLYALTKPWDETTTTWNTRQGTDLWEAAGAAGPTDYVPTSLAEIRGPQLGALTVDLNASGLALLQAWLENPSTNHGFIIQNYTTGDDGLDFASRETAESSFRPLLELEFESSTSTEMLVDPIAQFELSSSRGTGESKVRLDGTHSNLPGTEIVTWVWDFGDQTTGIGPEVEHQYQQPGTYEVRLTVVNSAGAEDSVSKIVIVDEGENSVVSFQQGVLPLSSYEGAEDVKLHSDNATLNYGNDVSLFIDGFPYYSTLMRWDLSAIAPGVEVTSARMHITITDPGSDTYFIYPSLQEWKENEATWLTVDGKTPWAMAGAAGLADRSDVLLGSLAGGTRGVATIELNEEGRTQIAEWINNSAKNHGFVIQNFETAEDGIDFLSSEAADPVARPRLEIAYRIAHHASQPEKLAFSAWPNPFSDQVSVEVESDIRHAVKLELYDMLGRRVLTDDIDAGSFNRSIKLDTSFLAAGVYAVVMTEHGSWVSKTKMITKGW